MATKKKAVAGTRKRKRRTVGAKRRSTVSGRRSVGSKSRTIGKRKTCTIGAISKAEKLVKEINMLEKKRKKATQRELRDIIQLEINERHDALDAMRKRRRSA